MRRLNVETVLSLSAVFLSLCGLVVSVVQTRAVLQQQRASQWPHLETSFSDVDEFHWSVTNVGTGVASIRSVEITFEGERFDNFSDVLNALLARRFVNRVKDPHHLSIVNSYVNGRTLRPGDEVKAFRLRTDDKTMLMIADTYREADISYRIVYSSIYDDCWALTEEGTKQLDACPK